MNGSRGLYRFLFQVLFTAGIVAAVTSCSMSATRKSFTGKLTEIDALIEQGQDADAVSELKKIEKKTYDSWSRIGIFRRYDQLGESELAERVLKNGLKRNPENTELSAVYAHFLLRQGRYAEAAKTAECLRGSAYGSIYSEAYIDDVLYSVSSTGGKPSFTDIKFYPVYLDAYNETQDSYWLRNCAVIEMTAGDYDKAFSLRPDDCMESDDAYFWSLVSYDDKNYGTAAAFAEKARTLYPESSIRTKDSVSQIEIASMLSDSYVLLSETDKAEEIRHSLLDQMASDQAANADYDDAYKTMMPAVYVDSALYAEANSDDRKCSNFLTYAVDTWPDYVPGLIAYADLAYRTSLPLEETPQEQTLHDKGLVTLRMEKYDNRTKIPVSDAAFRMDRSLERKNDAHLYIARLNLKYKTDKTLSVNDKITDIWTELENSAVDTDIYPEPLLEFAVSKLLTYGQTDDAWVLYRRYIGSKYKFDMNGDFWTQTVLHKNALTLREVEYAAWFAANQRCADTAERLYEYCVYESSGNTGDYEQTRKIAPFVSTSSCMNLAMIYSSLGAAPQALSLYSAAASRSVDVLQKAEIMYRMAVIYAAQQKIREAVRSVEYALALDPFNARAKLLRDQLSLK
ncbi:MAG: hypothetical protein M0P01_07685 [Treponema sp.]|nr:hypothetical protein [Treponema sp.]